MKLPVQVRKTGSSNPFFDAKYIIEDADERYIAESTKASAADHIALVLNSHSALLEACKKSLHLLDLHECSPSAERDVVWPLRTAIAMVEEG